jgi:hypothetical protein
MKASRETNIYPGAPDRLVQNRSRAVPVGSSAAKHAATGGQHFRFSHGPSAARWTPAPAVSRSRVGIIDVQRPQGSTPVPFSTGTLPSGTRIRSEIAAVPHFRWIPAVVAWQAGIQYMIGIEY